VIDIDQEEGKFLFFVIRLQPVPFELLRQKASVRKVRQEIGERDHFELAIRNPQLGRKTTKFDSLPANFRFERVSDVTAQRPAK
jgi:hypothetical protein